MAPKPKAPTKTPTSGGAGAQNPNTQATLSSQYGGASSSVSLPTALQSAPYQELMWSGPDVPIPGATVPAGRLAPKAGKGSTPAEVHQAALEGLAKYFGITTSPPGTTLEQQVTDALGAKYKVFGGGTAATMGVQKTTEGGAAVGGSTGRGGNAPREVPETQQGQGTVSTPNVPNKNALHQIAVQLGLDPNADPLIAIAGKLGIANPKDNAPIGGVLTQAHADTTAAQYAGFVAESFNKDGSFKAVKNAQGKTVYPGQQIEQELKDAGYLDVNTSGGTPTANDIQKAYQGFLNAAVNGVKTGNLNTSLPPGQGLQAAIAYGTKQAKDVQASATSSESYAYTQGIAAEFGVYLTPMQINNIIDDPKIAAEITSTGSPTNVADQIKDMVIKQYNPNNPNDPAGVANSMFVGLQQAALKYQLPLSTDQINQMVQNGLQTASVAYPASAVNDVVSKATEQFQTQAEGLYPSLAAQIKAGTDVQTLTAPYFNVAEAVTGVPASSMMADNQTGGGTSKWSAFMQGGQAQAGGTKTSGTAAATEGGNQTMTLDEWKKYLMANPQYGFSKTQGGRDMGEQMASAILNEFGKVNTEGGTSTPFSAFSPSSDFAVNTGSG